MKGLFGFEKKSLGGEENMYTIIQGSLGRDKTKWFFRGLLGGKKGGEGEPCKEKKEVREKKRR
ncbi:hypothetical protein N8B89_02110 [Enterococcus faecium]